MERNHQAIPRAWSSLSLRLSTVFVALLVAAALAVGYLFDRGRAEALEQRELDHLRLHAERGADELGRFVRQLRGDVLFLADTPPILGIHRALERGGVDHVGNSTLEQWEERLQQIFLSFAEARPEYFQIRLIGVQDQGREIVRVERASANLRVIPNDALQRKGQRYYFQEASRLKPGSVYLSRIDLNREHGRISLPHMPTLRAATPVQDPSGNLFGVVVVNMDMGLAFARADSFRDTAESAYIADERGDFLLHPQPGRAFAHELGAPFRLADAFPDHAERLARAPAAGGAFLQVPGTEGELVAYSTGRAWDPGDPTRRLVYILTEPVDQVLHNIGLMRRDSLLGMGGLLVLAILLVVIMVRRLTRSLSVLAKASGAIAEGDYRVSLPMVDSGEVGSLVFAFQHMAAEVERREVALAELNRDLERRVDERTRELAHQHNLQRLILDNIADGVVVSDCDGHFLLWNRKAEQMVGSGPEEVPPGLWSSHFGLFRDESGDPVPVEELPLVRAIHGESTDNTELYLHNPKCMQGRWALITARPLYDMDGTIAGGVAVLVDVTEQKRLHERVQGNRIEIAKVGRLALSAEVASSAAHQLSQPIAAMCNYAGAAVRLHDQGRLAEGELSDILSRIEGLATQSGEILDKLRARIRRRQQPPIPVDVNQVVASCLDLLRDRLERQGVKLELRSGEGLPMLIGDPIELEQVLVQLVSNALDAMESTERGERRLVVHTGHDLEGDLVTVEIGDTGPGVSKALAERLFEPWETDKPGALGIGLSIAQTIVEAFGGRIRMEKGAAGGASFWVELPVSREAKG